MEVTFVYGLFNMLWLDIYSLRYSIYAMGEKFPGFVFQVVWDTLAVTFVPIMVSCVKFHVPMNQNVIFYFKHSQKNEKPPSLEGS